MTWRIASGLVFCALGVLLCLFGLWGIGSYIWGVMQVIGAADQSWMFWGLAIAMLGLFGGLAGIGLTVLGLHLLKRSKTIGS